MGGGATTQWGDKNNWKAQGTVADGIPENTLVCLFVNKGGKMQHTGFGYNGMTCECSNGVEYYEKMKSKWTHWGIPACIKEESPIPNPAPKPDIKKLSGICVVDVPNDGTVNLRKQKSTGSTVIGTIREGEDVEVLNDDGSWCEVDYYVKKHGYIMTKFLREKG